MYRYRICYSKENEMKYISHLDLQRTVSRALRRARVPVALSQGFNPQPRLVFAAPLAVGIEGKNEYLDLYLTACREEEQLRKALNEEFPAGLHVKSVIPLDLAEKPLSALVEAALYVALLTVSPQISSTGAILSGILEAEEIIVARGGKKGDKNKSKEVNIRPFILALEAHEPHIRPSQGNPGGAYARLSPDPGPDPGPDSGFESGPRSYFPLLMLLATGSRGGARPEDIMSILPSEMKAAAIYRENIFIRRGGADELMTPEGSSCADCLEKQQKSSY